jgi:hypothetical protein
MNGLLPLVIEETPKTPHIDLNNISGDLIFSGKSIPENAAKVYEPVLQWAVNYIQDPRPTTNVRFQLEYFNTASSIWIAKVLKALTKIGQPDYVLVVHVYIAIEDFDELREMDDIKEAFGPVSDILTGSVASVSLRIYGIDEEGEVIKDRLVFI